MGESPELRPSFCTEANRSQPGEVLRCWVRLTMRKKSESEGSGLPRRSARPPGRYTATPAPFVAALSRVPDLRSVAFRECASPTETERRTRLTRMNYAERHPRSALLPFTYSISSGSRKFPRERQKIVGDTSDSRSPAPAGIPQLQLFYYISLQWHPISTSFYVFSR